MNLPKKCGIMQNRGWQGFYSIYCLTYTVSLVILMLKRFNDGYMGGYMEYSVGKVAKMFNLSRTTLLYYDSIGLLTPAVRSSKRYRIYSDSDIEKLRKIVLYKDAGVPLGEIDKLISASENSFVSIIMRRLDELNKELSLIKAKQNTIVNILCNVNLFRTFVNIDQEAWREVLSSVGMSKEQAIKWHVDFEHNSPEQHRNLLLALGIPEDEADKMREYFQNYSDKNQI